MLWEAEGSEEPVPEPASHSRQKGRPPGFFHGDKSSGLARASAKPAISVFVNPRFRPDQDLVGHRKAGAGEFDTSLPGFPKWPDLRHQADEPDASASDSGGFRFSSIRRLMTSPGLLSNKASEGRGSENGEVCRRAPERKTSHADTTQTTSEALPDSARRVPCRPHHRGTEPRLRGPTWTHRSPRR